jgi:hypothetical protein
MRRRSRFFTAAVVTAVALSLLVESRSVLAQGAAATPSKASEPLQVWIDARNTELDKSRLRDFLARELKRDVAITPNAGAAAVQIRVQNGARAQVEYTTGTGERLTRDVELPPDKDRSLEVLSWLTVNLVRDEASELLHQLRARRKGEADARAAEQAAAEQAAADKAAADKAAADKPGVSSISKSKRPPTRGCSRIPNAAST